MSDYDEKKVATDFEKAEVSGGFLSELIGFAKHNKKWWLLPIILVMLALGVLVIFGGSGAAPFIYTLF